MSSNITFENANSMLEGARKARLNLCVFHHDAQVPGEVASISRLLYRHIPELARRAGAQLEPNEGHPPGIEVQDKYLVDMISKDVAAGRDVVAWLNAVAAPETKSIFGKGHENGLNAFMDSFAKDRGFERNDALSEERAPKINQAAAFARLQESRVREYS
jgi:hypothetical protein